MKKKPMATFNWQRRQRRKEIMMNILSGIGIVFVVLAISATDSIVELILSGIGL